MDRNGADAMGFRSTEDHLRWLLQEKDAEAIEKEKA